jgi:hypothetical protein
VVLLLFHYSMGIFLLKSLTYCSPMNNSRIHYGDQMSTEAWPDGHSASGGGLPLAGDTTTYVKPLTDPESLANSRR